MNMIQKAPANNSRRSRKRGPSETEIARRREAIQSQWSSEERRKRHPRRRRNEVDLRLEAHVKFIEFLLAHHAR
jgi:hypothetical protein